MEMVGKVRRLYCRDKKSAREIARMTGLSRNTVAKWLEAPVHERPKYRRKPQPTKLAAFHERLIQALSADAQRPKRERRTARALLVELKAAGYDGGYSRLTDFVRAWRGGAGQSVHTRAFVPLVFELGEAYQFDWSDEALVIAGVYRRLQLAHMKLCASRAFWLGAYPTQGHEMLFDAHARGFAALGIARRGLYDNMKTAVDRVHKGKGRTVNSRFAVMCAHYLVEAEFCNVAAGWEKGIVEKNVQDSRRRVWLEATQRRWGSLSELNVWLEQRCRWLWQQLRHPEHGAFSIAEMHEHEREHLLPMTAPFDGYVEKPARVSSTCLVSVAKNRYSVPCEFAGQAVSARLYPQRVKIVAGEQLVAEHERLSGESQTQYDWQHYIPLVQRKPGALRNGAPFADLPEALQRLRRALLREDGGDRAMAKVLAMVPTAGLEAVLVAVELALETALPSGRISVEHVLNVLARLNAATKPEEVATALRVRTPPLADTARYDALRAAVGADVEADHA